MFWNNVKKIQLFESLLFCELGAHAKFWNPTTTPYGRMSYCEYREGYIPFNEGYIPFNEGYIPVHVVYIFAIKIVAYLSLLRCCTHLLGPIQCL
jgi:hypothetical protein